METGSRPKTALFGGTFDPLHRGHLELLSNIYDELCPDRMMVIPAGHPYFKEQSGRNITPVKMRLEMLKEGLSELDIPWEISLIETKKEGPSYTIDTVMQIKSEDSGSSADAAGRDYYFLCGSDVLFTIETWHEYRRLLSEIILTVIPRGDDDRELIEKKKDQLENDLGARVYISSFVGRDISSSMIREDPEKNKDLIPQAVYEYIIKHRLYGI